MFCVSALCLQEYTCTPTGTAVGNAKPPSNPAPPQNPIPPQNAGTLNCPICGKNPRNGKVNCCASGGSWFGKCGNPGDPRFQYTWADGSRLCKGNAKSLTRSTTCPICGTWTDTGKVSCCATGGSWHGLCGARSKGFKHTWNDGVTVCDGAVNGAALQAQSFSFANITQHFDSAQQVQQLPKTAAATNVLLHRVVISILALIIMSMY